jgi:hypothetical protein
MAELNRVEVTETAADLLRNLTGTYGPLMFHQSGGCCDGSSPMCYPDGDFITSEADVLLGQRGEGPGQRVLGRGPGGRALPDQVPAADRRGACPFLRLGAAGGGDMRVTTSWT